MIGSAISTVSANMTQLHPSSWVAIVYLGSAVVGLGAIQGGNIGAGIITGLGFLAGIAAATEWTVPGSDAQ